MRHELKLSTFVLLSSLALFGCGEEKAAGDKAGADVKSAAAGQKDPAAKGKAGAKGKGKGAAKPQADDDTAPPLAVPEGFKYEPQGRRDPFVNPIPKPPPAAPEIPTIRPNGLAGVLLAEAKITQIITSRESAMNMITISAPGQPQRKTYFAKKGDSLFDAVIKEIRKDEVVFTMISPTTKQPVNREMTVKTGSTAGTSAGDKK